MSIKKVQERQGKATGLAVLSEVSICRVVVVVDDDIDVFNERDVVWAAITRVNPKRDVSYIENVGGAMSTGEFGNNKLIIDATRTFDKPTPSVIEVPSEALERMVLEEWLDSRRNG